MFGLALNFSAPLVLGALLALPVLYLLLRITPPPPRSVRFPPAELFLKPVQTDSTRARMPWWLLLLRLLLLALVILAMAGPNLQRPVPTTSGPLLVVLDDSWPGAAHWSRRLDWLSERLMAAQTAGRPVALALASLASQDIHFATAREVLERLKAAKPTPLLFDRAPLVASVQRMTRPAGMLEILWVSDGLAAGDFARELAKSGALTIVMDEEPVFGVNAFSQDSGGVQVGLLRSKAGSATGEISAQDARGQIIATAPFDFGTGLSAQARLDLPVDLRNEIAQVQIKGVESAGAVFLLDESHRRARIGLFAPGAADVGPQSLLSSAYYLKKALAPICELIEPSKSAPDPLATLIEAQPSLLVLAGVGTFSAPEQEKLSAFLAAGGIVVRFAGPHVVGDNDPFLPVKLRRGGRSFGGALSWEAPKSLAPFEAGSPFAGLNVPEDVSVSRQVLAEPEPGLSAKVWAALSDGTPLVTAEPRGKGMVVLFHVSADPSWSNLALSGLYVEMLQRLTQNARHFVGEKNAGEHAGVLPPLQSLNGFGVLGAPAAQASALPAGFDGLPSVEHPPGLYGAAGQDFALNALNEHSTLTALDSQGTAIEILDKTSAPARDLRPLALSLALVLFALDTILMLGLGRLWPRGQVSALVIAAALVLLGVGMLSAPAHAQTGKALGASDIEASLNVHLAYVLSGDASVDDISRKGLQALSETLARRTSVSPGEPIGLDPARDVLDLYPLIYWPVVAQAPQPANGAMQAVSAYMKNGGTMLFDTRDALMQRADGPPTPAQIWLRQALASVDVPELEAVATDHVVTKSFYLLGEFYGRNAQGLTFLEALPPASADDTARPLRAADSVSPLIISANDLAAGWAQDAGGRPMFAPSPGLPRQHELALRGGINIVMYVLTGSYKADQVHMRTLLERLRN